MISLLAKYKRAIFTVVVVIFIGSIFFVSGEVFTSSSDAVAEVGGTKLPYHRFLTQVNRALDSFRSSGTDVNDVIVRGVKQEVFREMVVEELLSRQAGEIGMLVPDFEVAVEIQNTPQFTEGGAFAPRRYVQTIRQE
ncbi:MAG TPA: SurA N-terminal domain-containing protein, partial [Elusimicrobiales bacterium]|nr:SurA N-terminal domain-containing protein [Elusimicrobiales bacterium]